MSQSSNKVMESESKSKGPVEEPAPAVSSLSKPKLSKPPRSKMSKEKKFQIFAGAALGLFALAVILRGITYLIHFLERPTVLLAGEVTGFIFPSFIILEVLITTFSLPCIGLIELVNVLGYFKKNRKPLENLNNEVKGLTRMSYTCFAWASFATILGICSIYYVYLCGYKCPGGIPIGHPLGGRNQKCNYTGYDGDQKDPRSQRCFSRLGLIIPIVLLSMISMWGAGLMYLGILIMFFGKKRDTKKHPQPLGTGSGPQEASAAELITPQEVSTTTNSVVEQPSTSTPPIVPETINQSESNSRPEAQSLGLRKGGTTKRGLSKETQILLLKGISQIALSLAIILQSLCYWLHLSTFVPELGLKLVFPCFLVIELTVFVMFFSIMFWNELVIIVLSLPFIKIWEPLGKDAKREKSRLGCNATTCFVFLVIHVLFAIGGTYVMWTCWPNCEELCVKEKCTNGCEKEICAEGGNDEYDHRTSSPYDKENTCEPCRELCENNKELIKKCRCEDSCRNIGGVISLYVISLIFMLITAMVYFYIATFVKKNEQPPKPTPIGGQVLFQTENQEIKPVEEQASVEQSQK